MRLDIGCGANKRAGFVGVDFTGSPDILCDVSHERLPFDDASVQAVFSSHCLEHIPNDRLLHVFKEITRVCADGAKVEIWHPFVWHSDAFILGHVSFLSETTYDHIGCTFRDHWKDVLGAAWVLREVRYHISGKVLGGLEQAKMSVEFAVSHLRDVAHEIGIFATIDRKGALNPRAYRRTACSSRKQGIARLANGPRK